MQSEPVGQTDGILLHSSSSTQPPMRSAEPTNPVAHKHFASWLTIMHRAFGPHGCASHGCRQSLPTFGVGHKHRCCSSQIALPGQSAFVRHVTTVMQRTLGSGSGIEPSGQTHSNEPALLMHCAPWPHRFGAEHSSTSPHWIAGFPVNPGAHSHVNPPGLFVHTALTPHRPDGPCSMSHSLISMQPAEMSLGLYVQPSSHTQNASLPSARQ